MSELKGLEKAKSWQIFRCKKTEKGERLLTVAEGVKIFVGDREVQLHDTYRSIFLEKVEDSLDFKFKNGWITEDQKNDTLQNYKERGIDYVSRVNLK